MDEAIRGIAEAAKKAACISPNDYQDRDGFWVCGICHTRKQCEIQIPNILPRTRVFCLCDCKVAERDARKGRQAREESERKLKQANVSDMDTPAAKAMTLDEDDGSNPFMSKMAIRYVENWAEISTSGRGGLILWGTPGTGKTFFATAIGNALIEKGVTVARTTAAQVVENMQGLYDYEKSSGIAAINKHDLVILDDLGAERDTSFAREVMFQLVDDRCKRGLTTIVTTNMTIKQLQEPTDRTGKPDLGYKRITDRLLGVSTPVQLSGESHRRQEGSGARDMLKGIMQK